MPEFNWATWVPREETHRPTLDKFAIDLCEKVEPNTNKFAIQGDHMVLVAKDAAGTCRIFNMKIEQWHLKVGVVHGQNCPCHPQDDDPAMDAARGLDRLLKDPDPDPDWIEEDDEEEE